MCVCLCTCTCECAALRMMKQLQVLIICRYCADSQSATLLLLWSVLCFIFYGETHYTNLELTLQ